MTTQQFALPSGATPVDSTQTQQPPAGGSQQQFPLPPGATPIASSYAPDSAATGNGGDLDPATANGQGGDPISGGVAESLASTGKAILNLPKTIWHSLPPVALADSTKQTLSVINAYEQARSSGKSIPEAVVAADNQARQQDNISQEIQQRVAEFKKNPGQETVRALTDAATLAATIYGGGAVAEGAELPEAAATEAPEAADMEAASAPAETAATEQPNLIQKGKNLYQQVTQGEKVAQAPAQTVLREGATASAEDAGVADQVTNTPDQGIRTLLDDPIAKLAKTERSTYDALNEASGTDLKDLYDRQSEIQDALDDPTNIGQKNNLEGALKDTQAQIRTGEAQASENGVDPSTLKDAKAMTQQRYSMQAAKQKIFNNESVVKGNVAHGSPEEINVDSAIRNAENLNKPSKYAPEGSPTRLQQAFGKEGADNLLKGLYKAQRAGQTAAKVQMIARWIGGTFGVGTVLEGVKHLLP